MYDLGACGIHSHLISSMSHMKCCYNVAVVSQLYLAISQMPTNNKSFCVWENETWRRSGYNVCAFSFTTFYVHEWSLTHETPKEKATKEFSIPLDSVTIDR